MQKGSSSVAAGAALSFSSRRLYRLRVYALERETLIPAPRDRVFPFFAVAANLERLTPPSLRLRILTPGPIEIRAGTVIEYRLSLSGLPVRWRSLIETWEPPARFADVQLTGPYAFWRHTHSFEEAGDQTRMRDRVEYALPFGPLGALANGLFVKRRLAEIFDFRERAVRDLFHR
jgi:ligand-binding SRPBCC domain-containing protein